MLTIDAISKTFNPGTVDAKLALDHVSLTVEDGELVESTWRGTAFDPSTYDYDSYD